jgi:TonB family protein
MARLSIVAVVALWSSLAVAQGAVPASGATAQPAISATTPAPGMHVAMGEPFEWTTPKYPKDARKVGKSGDVVLMLNIDANGWVTGATPLSGDPELVDATIKAATKWKYVPYDLNGAPAPVTTKILARFIITETKPADVAVAFEVPPAPHFDSVYEVGHGVTAPKALSSPDPSYSDQARADHFQGTCVLSLIVGPDGRPYNVKPERTLGEGLDEKAIQAVRQWKFDPARKDGKPVPVAIKVEVQFRLQ